MWGIIWEDYMHKTVLLSADKYKIKIHYVTQAVGLKAMVMYFIEVYSLTGNEVSTLNYLVFILWYKALLNLLRNIFKKFSSWPIF